MCWGGLRARHTVPHGWEAHGEVQSPVYKRSKPTLSSIQIHIKVKHFQRACNVGNGHGTKAWVTCPACSDFPGSEGHWPPKLKVNVRRWHFSWPGLREGFKCPTYSSIAHKAISTEKEATYQVTVLGSTAKGCLSGRVQAGSETPLLKITPKD